MGQLFEVANRTRKLVHGAVLAKVLRLDLMRNAVRGHFFAGREMRRIGGQDRFCRIGLREHANHFLIPAFYELLVRVNLQGKFLILIQLLSAAPSPADSLCLLPWDISHSHAGITGKLLQGILCRALPAEPDTQSIGILRLCHQIAEGTNIWPLVGRVVAGEFGLVRTCGASTGGVAKPPARS